MSRYAVIIGSNGPPGPGMLRYAPADAERMAQVLDSAGGFETLMLSSTSDPHLIEHELAMVAEKCGPADTLVMFFSGHGILEAGTLLFMLDKTDIDRPLTSMLHADAMLKAMRFSAARFKLLILDCCHAGAVFGESRFKDGGVKVKEMLGQDASSTAFVTLVASDRLERTRELDELGGSFLTRALCEGLSDRFQEADDNRDGAIDLADLRLWLAAQAEQHNRKNPQSKVPVPFIFGRERGQFFLSADPQDWQPWEVESAGSTFVLIPARCGDRAWLIGKTPVTNRQFARFVDKTGAAPPKGDAWIEGKGGGRWKGPFHPWEDPLFSDPDLPVVCVDLDAAREYARWSNGVAPKLEIGLVPLEVWDFAAFGVAFPTYDPSFWRNQVIHDKCSSPAPTVGADDRANRFGVVDMLGNVWEWTRPPNDPPDRYQELAYLDELPANVGMIVPRLQTRRAASTGSAERARKEAKARYEWRLKFCEIRGGSYLDDLTKIRPTVTIGILPERGRTSHSDLGFRLAAKIRLEDLPAEVARRSSNWRDIPEREPGATNDRSRKKKGKPRGVPTDPRRWGPIV